MSRKDFHRRWFNLGLAPFAAALALTLPIAAANAATLVKADLWNNDKASEMPTNFVYGAPNLDMSKAPMGIKLSRNAVPAGPVVLTAANVSKDMIHEMIVMRLADPAKPLPYIANENRVDESKAGDKGEVSELEFGKSGSLTITLAPGKYLLICNIPGHFAAGMRTTFTVTK